MEPGASDLHVSDLQLSPLPSTTFLAAAVFRIVPHCATGLPRLSWKLAVK